MTKVVITGGSSGIGKAIKDKLESISFEVIDFSRSSGVDITKEWPDFDCDILILNAGIWNDNDLMLALHNAHQEMFLAQVEKWKNSNRPGHVIFILSNAAYSDYGNHFYTMCKSGDLLFARRKFEQLRPFGIKVSTISPGTTDTDFWKDAKVDNRKFGCMKPETIAELVCSIIKAGEEGAIVTELIVLPEKKIG